METPQDERQIVLGQFGRRIDSARSGNDSTHIASRLQAAPRSGSELSSKAAMRSA
jgi:hypothetical protein